MCGVAGIYAYHYAANPVDRDELVRIRDHMRRRGPDAEGAWYSEDGRVGLGHRRLSIIDLDPRSNQPMGSTDGRVVISYNGEIYNYKALRKELEGQGSVFRTQSDTEVLMELYRRRGERMFEALRGMYAFALWDADKKAMLLARDPYGIKPLYYADDGRTCRVASQVKALLAGGVVPAERDPAGMAGFYLLGSVPEPWTWVRGIRAVPAGSLMWIRESGAGAPAVHTDITARRSDRSVPSSEDERDALVRRAIRDSVQAHLASDVPVGLFLSAGVDSGTLLALMSEASGQAVPAITLAFSEFSGRRSDEAGGARMLARRYGARHHTRTVTREEFERDLPAIMDAMDQPSIDGINNWFAAKAAHEAGLKVVFSGLGGDELFGGYDSFRALPRWTRRLRWGSRVPGLGRAFRRLSAPLLPHLGLHPKMAGLLELGGSWAGSYLLKRGLFMPWDLPERIGAEAAHEGIKGLQLLPHIEAAAGADPGTDFERISNLESSLYMRNQLLRDIDWSGMAHSIETRVPLVDATLRAELLPIFAVSSPRGKALLARCPRNPLPDESWARRKTGFLVPMSHWTGAGSRTRSGRAGGSIWSRGWAQSVARRFTEISEPRRVLVSTIKPSTGGVSTMTRFVVQTLRARGYQPVLAWYEPYSHTPSLSVPAFALGLRTAGHARTQGDDGIESHGLGSWLPELEFPHYWPRRAWRELIAGCAFHVSVSGNALTALPYARLGLPFLAWLATDWHGDRKDRIRRFPAPRRLLDRAINSPAARALERAVLGAGHVLALSEHTARELRQIAGEDAVAGILRMPVDTERFRASPGAVQPGLVGFVGRLSDPRKNISLLIRTLARCVAEGLDVRVELVGGELDAGDRALAEHLGLGRRIEIISFQTPEQLAQRLARWDVFVLPSHQEGLCIAALEAMACGVPVVSTRCGGPEEFVRDAQTGFLCEPEPGAMTLRVAQVVKDRGLRERLGRRARALVEAEYAPASQEAVFWKHFEHLYAAHPAEQGEAGRRPASAQRVAAVARTQV